MTGTKEEAKSVRSTIIVVDDSLLAVRLVKHALGRSGEYTLVTASSAQAARELMSRHAVDLAIVDIVMPHETGFDLARWIRAQPQFMQLPIIFFTADAAAETVREAVRFGKVDYLLKPLKPDLLRAKVGKLLAPPGGGEGNNPQLEQEAQCTKS